MSNDSLNASLRNIQKNCIEQDLLYSITFGRMLSRKFRSSMSLEEQQEKVPETNLQEKDKIMVGAGGENNPMVQAEVIIVHDGGNLNMGIQVNAENREPNKRKTEEEQDDEIAGFIAKIKVSRREIHDFIVIAERSPKMDPKLMESLENLKDVAYDAQDLLEDYEIADRRRSEEAANSMRVPDTMPKKLKELSERLEDIKKEAHAFKLEENVTNLQFRFNKERGTYPSVRKSHVFEREKEKELIVNWLQSNQAGDQENVSVVSIVGSGGIGKTTLAKLVFNHEQVQKHFELRMWICVSCDFDITRLGNEIIKCARDDHSLSDVSNVQQLQRRLGETLNGKKFLLVLDDVWNENHEKWDRLIELLSCGGSGSRIVVTTRSRKAQSIMSKIQPHILKPLSEDGCWSLFCQSAFFDPIEEPARSELEPIGREIVKKCRGNPLAVKTLGGLLRSERSQIEWEYVRDSKIWNLDDENENGILPALRLSYIHLKPHLKQCFAFCAIFPQDYKIQKELVIKLWMAQGFIPTDQQGLMELEDIGNKIFDELVMRSFFQDVKENEKISYGLFCELERTTFRMHDLMHDLAHSVMENEYCFVHDGMSKDISPRIRHVSSNGLGNLLNNFKLRTNVLRNLTDSLPKAEKLRTYVMLEQDAFQFPCDVGRHFKCLRALDFIWKGDKREVEKKLFTSLKNLQHLRYLNLSFTSIETLHESLTSLYYLQTLILIRCIKLCELPKEIYKLTNLRCLDITDCDKLTHMPPKMGQLSCLQELSNFIVGRTNEIACSGIGELQRLNHLRGSLSIKLPKNITDAIDVPRDTLINKPNLTSLDLKGYAVHGDLEEDRRIEVLEKQVLRGFQPHQSLKKLGIYHYGGLNFPSWMMDTTLTELVAITLEGCWRCNHLPPLGELPFLKVLRIFGLKNVECIGNDFYGNEGSGGFPSLEELHIHNMQKLKTWSGLEWKGERAFPSLVKLEISVCPMLTTMEVFPEDQIRSQSSLQYLQNLPEGIGNLTSLQYIRIYQCLEMESLPRGLQRLSALKELDIYGCHPSLEIRCTKDTGEDWDKIQHIPYIRILGGLMEEGVDLLEPEGDEDYESDEDYELVP